MRFLGFLAAALLPCLLRAGEADPPLEIELISEMTAIAPGKEFHLGLHLKHPPGTHTYWKHPGIVGLATTVEWELPPGFKAGEIQWPFPQVVKMGSHDAQGYEGETLLIIPITPPADLSAASVTLTAKASWMCCGRTCTPASKVPFSVTLPVAAASETNPAVQPLFQEFLRKIPPGPRGGDKISAKREGGKIILTMEPSYRQRDPFWIDGDDDWKIRFFTADGQIDSGKNQKTQISAEGVVTMTLPLSESGPKHPESLPGVLVIPTGKYPELVEINPSY